MRNKTCSFLNIKGLINVRIFCVKEIWIARRNIYVKAKDSLWRKKSHKPITNQIRKQHQYSQRDLACLLQLAGYDIDKNIITRIETDQRYVNDLELKAFSQIFNVSYEYLIEGKQKLATAKKNLRTYFSPGVKKKGYIQPNKI